MMVGMFSLFFTNNVFVTIVGAFPQEKKGA